MTQSTYVPENISSSSIHIDQKQEEQSSVQKENVKPVSLGKSDGLVSKSGVFGFVRTETKLVEEDDCSTSNSDNDDNNDDIDNEDDDQELLEEF
jgi:hypothetical protein